MPRDMRVGPHLNGLVSKAIGQWSEVHLGRTSWRLWGKFCSHSFEYKYLSNLLHIGESCIFDQVKRSILYRGWLNLHSLIKISKSLMLGVTLQPPIFFENLLMTLKSSLPPSPKRARARAHTHQFRKVKPKRSKSANKKFFLRIVLLGP